MMSNKSLKTFNIKLISFQLGCILAVMGGCSGIVYYLGYQRYSNKIYRNIQICHIDLSGKTQKEAEDIIENQFIDTILNKNLTLTLNETCLTLPLKDFYLSSNLQESIGEALDYSVSLPLYERWQLLRGYTEKNFDLQLDFNEQLIRKLTENFTQKLTFNPTNATISISSSGEITIVPHTNGQSIDTDKLLGQISNSLMQYTSNCTEVTMQGSNNSMDSILNIDLVDTLSITEPEITLEELQLVDSLVASYTTSFSATADNATNIKVAAQTINGILLMPGDHFSFNEIIGDTTLDKGYVYAPVIANSRITQGVGGGVCQVSSTLYNAILLAGLTPTERQPHSRPSSYVPLGLDSTIDWGNIDLKFENTLDYPLYISSFTENGNLHINLYSNKALLENTYELCSQVIQELPATTKFNKVSSLPSGSRQLISSGSAGYQVKVTRKTYHNNQLVNTEVISWDTYNPTSTIYNVG